MTSTEVLLTSPASPRGDRRRPGRAGGSGRYSLLVTREGEHLRAAQRLRHDVFAIEQGARLAPGRAAGEGRDEDAFDAFCDHVVVRDERDGAIVGTYRMLSPEGAAAAGGLYSDTEFDLSTPS